MATLSRDAYLKMIRAALPIPPQTEADNERLIQLMQNIDDRSERDGLGLEEKLFSELLAILVQDFEDKHYPLPSLLPHELLRGVTRGATQSLTGDSKTDCSGPSPPGGGPPVTAPPTKSIFTHAETHPRRAAFTDALPVQS